MKHDETRERPQRPRPLLPIGVAVGAAVMFASCNAFKVDVGTSEPIALEPIKFEPIDINMKVEVYQYTGTSKSEAKATQTVASVVESQRNRTAELEALLNARWAGENHLGLLSIRPVPPGKDAAWAQTILSAENADRDFLMRQKAKDTGTPIEDIRREQWENRKQSVWKGVLIEIAGEKEGEYRWAQRLETGGELVDESLWKETPEEPEPANEEN